ncbi:MAG: flavin reductase family protein [Microgenomates group bacterium]
MKTTASFLTNVGLITSNGKWGQDVMACEWTYQLSYDPPLIAVCIRPGKATFENIQETGEFGVSLASTDQNIVSSVAGNNHGKEVDKIAILKELGVKFYEAKSINTLMVEGATLNAECKLVKLIEMGDHPIFIGEIQTFTEHESDPIIYHKGKYFKLGEQIHKPDIHKLEHITELIQKHTK